MNKKGFTLIEMIVAIMILSIFILVVGAILTSSWKFWNSGWEQVRLQRDASYAFARIEKVVRDASDADLLAGNKLQLTKESGGSPVWTKTFQKSGNILQLDDGSTTENIISGVSSISFSDYGDTVTVNLNLQEETSQADFRTTILLRN